jgi:AhpD family alkylhydroperoxidase
MAYNVRELLNNFQDGIGELSKTNPDEVNAFMNMMRATYKTEALGIKSKELISVGISCYNRCEYCIVYHTHKAIEAGATKEEILEAAMVAVGFGGGPSMAYSVTLLKECIKEFENEFK